MRSRSVDGRHIVRLESGEPVVGGLMRYLDEKGVGFAHLSGAGALSEAEIGFWDPSSRAYRYERLDEQLEVVSFQGNASLRDGQPFLHVHVALGREDLSVVGGHLKEARVRPTLEVWLRTEDIDVRRARDPNTGLDLLDLPAGD